ncbi:MAG: bifunctional [glutamine synthetase] adenylyltransferase/[glutamine synthetase]-adenylyl-L-tyrosine phosphorylase [Alphaproteobacteria bacterium]|nr:bifunctional [glutamine synthetase] adenylyltransferase/[glutamine synthetase]-adenylyl-L-tyrosine phosphorylase [Alphaproteobacteria bacterium]
MDISNLLPDPAILPLPADPERAALGRERWREAATGCSDAQIGGLAMDFDGDPLGGKILDAIFGNSPFLGRCAVQELPFLVRFTEADPRLAFAALADDLRKRGSTVQSSSEIDRLLRTARRRMALLTGICDITGRWTLEQVVSHLSAFADAAVGEAVAFHLRETAKAGGLRLADPNDPQTGSGFIVLAVGKLGAQELNYSSDIDLIVLFDDEIVATDEPISLQKTMVRLTRNLMRTLDEQTKDGYVFRTDLRLRPDPASTPLAVSVRAAETYYESTGQNWERAAMIKARPIAGDFRAGSAFIDYLTPFVWRKNLDFAAIEDIHSIKRQIHAHRGGADVALHGHNIKLGRGGIREIEFFAQTQQLVWGGRNPDVRLPATCDALRALARAGHINESAADILIDSYRFLRRVEHRLQMIDDRQTQTLPSDDAGLTALAVFLGYPDGEALETALLQNMRAVEEQYAQLFEEAPSLSGPGNLVFTGSEDDPGTLATLTEMGYADPRSVAAVIRGWHHGRYRATRNNRTRQILTALMPALLSAFSKTANPLAALMKFDEFLARLPAGIQVFSLFHSNPGLIDLLAEIMGSAPRLADHLSRNAGLLDAVLSADFFDPPPPRDGLSDQLHAVLWRARDFEDVLDLTRRWTKDYVFRLGVQMLRNRCDAEVVGYTLADIADLNIEALQGYVEKEFALQHGSFGQGGMAVIALGRLGGREMTVTSDLDLIFVYDVGSEAESIGGPKPLAPSHYYARLSQRFLSCLTAPTAEGTLYEVDMRLRPSGNQGPIASSLDAFRTYQSDTAWTWEHMALTRARVVSGPPALRAAIEKIIGATLTRPRPPDALLHDVAEMRVRIEGEHPADSVWDSKHVRGGLVDIEFVAQYMQLRHAANQPEILATNTIAALQKIGDAGLIDAGDADTLREASHLWHQMQGLLRLTLDLGFDPEVAPQGLKDTLAKAANAVDFADLEVKLQNTATRVRAIFDDIIQRPAAMLETKPTEEEHQ